MLAIPLPDASFDVALCQQGLQQFPDRLAALREMRRVLVEGGRLALSVWSRIEGNPGMAALVAALEHHVGDAAANNRRAPLALGDADELHAFLHEAGFQQVELRTLVEIARFPSPDAFVEAQLAATPLSTLGALDEDTRRAIIRDVRADVQMLRARRPLCHSDGGAHCARAEVGRASLVAGVNLARQPHELG